MPGTCAPRRVVRPGFVVDSLCCVSRSSIFTGQYPHQTGVRTNTPRGSSTEPARRLARVRGLRQPRARVQRDAPGAGYTTGFVGKYLNEYEYVAGPGAAADAAGLVAVQRRSSARPTTAGTSTAPTSRRPAAAPGTTRRRRCRRPRRQRDKAYAGSVVGTTRTKFIKAPPRRRRAVLPRGRALRAAQPHQPRGPLPRRPGLPAGVPRPPGGKRPARATAAGRLHVADRARPARLRRPPRRTTGPRKANGKRGPGVEHRPNPFRPAQSVARPAQPRDDGAVGRPHGAPDPAPRRRRTPTSCSPPTTASTSARTAWAAARAPPTTPTCASRCSSPGPGVVPGARAELTSNLDLAPDLRGARRRRARRPTAPAPRSCRPSPTRRWCGATTSSSSTPRRR